MNPRNHYNQDLHSKIAIIKSISITQEETGRVNFFLRYVKVKHVITWNFQNINIYNSLEHIDLFLQKGIPVIRVWHSGIMDLGKLITKAIKNYHNLFR